MSRARLRPKPCAESWAEPWVSSRAGLPSRTEPGPRPDPKHQAEPSDARWAMRQAKSNPESTKSNPQVSPELSPELSLSQAPSWAEPIELIPESQAEPEPKAEMSRGPNSESSWVALHRSLSCDKPSLELSALSKPRRASSQAEPSPKLRATKCRPVVWCSANRAGVMWNGQRWVISDGQTGIWKICLPRSEKLMIRPALQV